MLHKEMSFVKQSYGVLYETCSLVLYSASLKNQPGNDW